MIEKPLDSSLNNSEKEELNVQNTKALYQGYYLFGQYSDNPIWRWENWKKCMPLIQPVIDIAQQAPTINSSQAISVPYKNNEQYASHKDLRFGRMTYTEKNNEKWATKYVNEKDWTYFDTEIVYPSFYFCDKHGVNPDVFIKVTNEDLSGSRKFKINQSLIILFKNHLANSEQLKMIEQNVNVLGDMLNAILIGEIVRPASFPSEIAPHLAVTDYIRDGSHGVVDHNELDFSRRFKKYGMQTVKRVTP